MGLAVSMGVFGVSQRSFLVSLPLLRRVIHAPAPFFLNGSRQANRQQHGQLDCP
jgi:hypothetical protein